MKNAIMLGLALGMSMLLVGCGGNSPEGTANEFLEAFSAKKDKLDGAKKACRGYALNEIEKYQARVKDAKKDPEASWMDDWTSSKDVDKITDMQIVAVMWDGENSTAAQIQFEYKLHRPKQKEEKNKILKKYGSLTVSSVDGSWKVVRYNFGR